MALRIQADCRRHAMATPLLPRNSDGLFVKGVQRIRENADVEAVQFGGPESIT